MNHRTYDDELAYVAELESLKVIPASQWAELLVRDFDGIDKPMARKVVALHFSNFGRR